MSFVECMRGDADVLMNKVLMLVRVSGGGVVSKALGAHKTHLPFMPNLIIIMKSLILQRSDALKRSHHCRH